MRYVEAISDYDLYGTDKKVFLAGGITNCPDWQQEMITMLDDTTLTVLNPRRADFPIGDPNAAQVQIKWEYDALRAADVVSFWFPKETICPIVLYELGAWSMTGKPLCIGVHEDYQRKQDVLIQTKLIRPEIEIVYTLADLVEKVKEHDLGSCGHR